MNRIDFEHSGYDLELITYDEFRKKIDGIKYQRNVFSTYCFHKIGENMIMFYGLGACDKAFYNTDNWCEMTNDDLIYCYMEPCQKFPEGYSYQFWHGDEFKDLVFGKDNNKVPPKVYLRMKIKNIDSLPDTRTIVYHMNSLQWIN